MHTGAESVGIGVNTGAEGVRASGTNTVGMQVVAGGMHGVSARACFFAGLDF